MVDREKILRPMSVTTGIFWALFIILVVGAVAWLYAWSIQLTNGLVITGLRDLWIGSPWGLYISGFIWWVGIAHGGIAIAAVVYLLNLNEYRSLARIGEIVTILALSMAGLSVLFDLGRPDRVANLIFFWIERVGQSPFIWDLTVIMIYFSFSIVFLWLTLRKDLKFLVEQYPRFKWLYKILLLGYRDGEEEKIERMAKWLALGILSLLVLLSGGVIPWIFGLISARAGWYGGLQGPYFLTAAVLSAIAIIIVIAGLLMKIYGWEEVIKPSAIRGLSNFLGVLIIFYFWFILHEQLTMRYAPLSPEMAVSSEVLFGTLSPLFWAFIIMLLLAFIYLAVQAFYPKAFNVTMAILVSILVLIAMWIKRLIIVISTFTYPGLLYPGGPYIPTFVEMYIGIGTVIVFTLGFLVFMKLFPIIPLEAVEE